MKKGVLLLIVLLTAVVSFGQSVEVSGPQTGVWDADTIRVTDDITVVDSLVVFPGTVVLFDGFYSILVSGEAIFEARGTEDDSVRFTVADTTGFSIYDSGEGGWNGFHLTKARKARFDYCVLEYAKASDTTDMLGGALRISLCDDVVISHSTLRCNRAREQGGALSAQNSHVVMTDCSVIDNAVFGNDNIFYRYGGGLQFLKCDVELQVMEFLRNNGEVCVGGALSLDSCSVLLDRAVFSENIGVNGAGLYLMRSNHKDCRLSNLLFEHNLSRHFGGGLAFSDVSADVYNILVTNNDSEGVSCSGIFFYQDCAPKLTNCIVYGNYPGHSALNPDTVQMWLWTFDGYAPEFRNCLIEGGTKYIRGAEFLQVFDNIIDEDPLFVDAEHRDFHLSENSPCRDAGNANVPSFFVGGVDLDGNPRVMNQWIDIGPYEYPGTVSISHHQLDSPQARLIGNPLNAKSHIEVEDALEGTVQVSVYSLTGRCVVQKTYCLAKTKCIEIGDLAERLVSGVYLIEVASHDRTYSIKAVR